MLGSLTATLNAGSFSSSNTQTFADLTNSIEHIAVCFQELHTLTIDIEWEIDQVQDCFAPLYTVLLEHGQAKASELPSKRRTRSISSSCASYNTFTETSTPAKSASSQKAGRCD
jgi:hypothetical protein